MQDSHANPTEIIAIPMTNNQPDRGRNSTSKIPSPKPIKHTPIVFFNAPNIFISSYPFLYIILVIFLFVTFYVLYFYFKSNSLHY